MSVLIILLIMYYIVFVINLAVGNFNTKKEFLKNLIPFYGYFNFFYTKYKKLE